MADRNGTRLGLDAAAKPLVIAGLALGVGLGGFFDGIVFHQLHQIHNMLSSYPDASVATDLELNVMADGIFHLATYTFTITGVVLLFRAWRLPSVSASGRTLLGASIMGWDAFNLVDHQLLGLHHVWPAGPGRRVWPRVTRPGVRRPVAIGPEDKAGLYQSGGRRSRHARKSAS
ncbi:DUF2243 domain-containing protein [Natrinema saccharevitans]|uniref:DUF2243 domain-containing protein n=1 Tax=Natrinema saccharevitans TaxID=301967 RepID=UPI001FEB9F66|nr:DUF2243 domain-containing protein [Natrinema saccharevitans]